MEVVMDRAKELLMKALDDCLDPDERSEWDALVAADAELAEEFQSMRETTMEMTAFKQRLLVHRTQAQAVKKSGPWAWVGLVTMGLGMLTLWCWELVMLFSAPEVPMVAKIAVGLVSLGVTVAFFVVARERLATRKNDRYLEVDR